MVTVQECEENDYTHYKFNKAYSTTSFILNRKELIQDNSKDDISYGLVTPLAFTSTPSEVSAFRGEGFFVLGLFGDF